MNQQKNHSICFIYKISLRCKLTRSPRDFISRGFTDRLYNLNNLFVYNSRKYPDWSMNGLNQIKKV